MFELKDTLSPSGLDTLSEHALRLLTERWTGSLHSEGAQTAGEVVDDATFDLIVGRWRKAREVYHDASAESVVGETARYAEGVEPMMSADSLSVADVSLGDAAQQVAADSLSVTDAVMVQPVSAQEVMLAAEAGGVGEWTPLMYNLLIALTLLYYIFCVYRYFDDIVALFHSVFQRRVIATDRATERSRSDIFYGSLGKLFMLGMAFIGLLAALFVSRADLGLSPTQLFYLPFLSVGVFILILIVQYICLAFMGFLTRSMAEISALMRIRLIYFVLSVVMVAPVLLVSQMGAGGAFAAWYAVAIVAALIALILFVRESISFFISKKVSILHWILYLCTVEILPLSLLWQGVERLT